MHSHLFSLPWDKPVQTSGMPIWTFLNSLHHFLTWRTLCIPHNTFHLIGGESWWGINVSPLNWIKLWSSLWDQVPSVVALHTNFSHEQHLNDCCTEHYRLLLILTHSMMQSPSWAANWFAASQEIPRISRKPKVHYRTHKRPPPVSTLGQPNPVHIPTSHLLESHPNIHPSKPRSPQWSPSLQFP